MNGIDVAERRRRAVLAVCAVYSDTTRLAGVLRPVVRSRWGASSLGFLVGKPTPVSRCTGNRSYGDGRKRTYTYFSCSDLSIVLRMICRVC